jgi:signal transduction histidine kinase
MVEPLPARTRDANFPDGTAARALLLGERLQAFAFVRLLVAAAVLLGAVFATYVVGIEGLSLPALSACAAFLLAYGLLVFAALRAGRRAEEAARRYRHFVRAAHTTIFVDYVALTAVIWLVGGSRSPFVAFYLLHAMLASVLLTKRAAMAHAAVGYLLLAGMVVGQWSGLVPVQAAAGAVLGDPRGDFRPMLTILAVYGVLTLVATVLMTGIAEKLREGERRLRAAGEDLARLANLRRAFLHVAVHDLREPVQGTVTLLDNIAQGLGGPVSEQQKRWLERGDARLRGLLDLLRDLSVLGELETGRLESVMQPVNLAELAEKIVADHADRAAERGLSLRFEPPAKAPMVRGVERLLSEAITNYVSNALKYAREAGNIVTRVVCSSGRVRLEVADDGPGIDPAQQSRLFREFTRLRSERRDGRPEPQGRGLGLSIVRRIAEAHGGEAGVESAPGVGSTFYFEVPGARGLMESISDAAASVADVS